MLPRSLGSALTLTPHQGSRDPASLPTSGPPSFSFQVNHGSTRLPIPCAGPTSSRKASCLLESRWPSPLLAGPLESPVMFSAYCQRGTAASGPGSRRPRSSSALPQFPGCPRMNHVASLGLSFLICKTEVGSPGGCD